MKEVIAPKVEELHKFDVFIYLAGSIESGKAEHWQKELINEFKNEEYIVFFNPRREVWDENCDLKEQINWELDHLKIADIVIVYFDPNSVSPITLLELGAFINSNIFVCCPDGYFRKQNVVEFCNRNSVTVLNTKEELINSLREELKYF